MAPGAAAVGGSAAREQPTPAMKRRKVVEDDDDDPAEPMTDSDNSEPEAVVTPLVAAAADPPCSPELLRLYYGRLFPYQEMCQWLAYGNDSKHPQADSGYFSRREFSFTLENDVYIRYQSFRGATELQAAIRNKAPNKIDIGAVYNVEPSKRTAFAAGSDRVFAPVERELVFDVDMTDYDDVRICCTGADICNRCWCLMSVAIEVVDTALREDFGFKHILWVYSGRRGVHCWVCDPQARLLTDEQRCAISDYLAVYKGGEHSSKSVHLTTPLHPALSRAQQILSKYWVEQFLPQQELLAEEESWEKVLGMVPDEDVKEKLRDSWHSGRRASTGNKDDSVTRWKEMQKVVTARQKAKNAKVPWLRRCLDEIIFTYIYPRLDVEVSKHMNHLLKSPFCVHPKTGRVCVPMDPAKASEFDPLAVPSVQQARLVALIIGLGMQHRLMSSVACSQLVDELNAHAGAQDSSVPDYMKTSLAQAIDLFRSSFLDDMRGANKDVITAAVRSKNSRQSLVY
eukprot:jgi/Chlat1/453/Chrsp103S01064